MRGSQRGTEVSSGKTGDHALELGPDGLKLRRQGEQCRRVQRAGRFVAHDQLSNGVQYSHDL